MPSYDVDFSDYEKDLVSQALSRILSQHYNKCLLRQFFAAFIFECQELYDVCIELQKKRVIANAVSENLDALGRIVGEDRNVWHFDETYFMYFDKQGQSFDQAPMWCIGAPLNTTVALNDMQYRENIIARAVKNHTLVSSVPELQNFIALALSTQASFQKTGPNKVRLIANAGISVNQLYRLMSVGSDDTADDVYWMPYPATLSLEDDVIYVPSNFFMFDLENRGFDVAPVSVGSTYNIIG